MAALIKAVTRIHTHKLDLQRLTTCHVYIMAALHKPVMHTIKMT